MVASGEIALSIRCVMPADSRISVARPTVRLVVLAQEIGERGRVALLSSKDDLFVQGALLARCPRARW
jgi:hypothetical protein